MPTRIDSLSEETRDQLAEIALKMSSGKTRPKFLGILKEVAPDTAIPEIDTKEAVEAALKGERAEREKFEAEQRNRWLQEDLGKTKKEVREAFSLTDEDFTKMEKMMTEKTLPADYKWAAQLYRQQTDSATPTNYGNSGYGPVDIEGFAKGMEGLMENPDAWAVKTAHEMVDDIQRKGAGKAW